MVMKNIHILRIFMWLRFICAAALTTVFPILVDEYRKKFAGQVIGFGQLA